MDEAFLSDRYFFLGSDYQILLMPKFVYWLLVQQEALGLMSLVVKQRIDLPIPVQCDDHQPALSHTS
jgi:hypothetical protein